MNKRGITIIELLISIVMISLVILFFTKVMFSLNNINNDKTYASNDEITRAEIIKNIESDFLKLKLNGLDFIQDNKTIIKLKFREQEKDLVILNNKLVYDNLEYELESEGAKYQLCPEYTYKELDNNYYLVKIVIKVLIDGVNTTINDDIVLTYIGLKNGATSYLENLVCLENNN